MGRMKLYIKNMVCDRCILAVRTEFEKLGIPVTSVSLGEVEVDGSLTDADKRTLAQRMEALGFALIDDRRSRLNEQIKTNLIEWVQNNHTERKLNLSDYLSDRLHYDYNYLSTLFSEIEGISLEKYFITLKIEKVKELLVYDELTLSEIADRLHYSSVAHLSNQFKKITGLTPSHFKEIGIHRRKPFDKL